jgi:FkbM family methyltransferase
LESRSTRGPDAFLSWVRGRRAQSLMALHLVNWRDTWRAFRTGSHAPPPLRFRNGLFLRGRPEDSPILLFFEVFAAGCYRRLAASCDGAVADLGANIGAFTIDWLHRNRRARVHAYEPDPETCAVFRENVAANGMDPRVVIWNEAVARCDGRTRFARNPLSLGSRTGSGALSVGAVSLETVVERAGGSLDLAKLDVEGAEADLLEGGALVLPRVRQVVGEYHEQLVPDVRARIAAALGPSHVCRMVQTRRCGSMFTAERRPELT